MLILLALLLQTAHAEYRAFELVIYNSTSGQERVVVSNLDPRQYRKYFPVKLDEEITYRNTWMCRGNTANFKPTCPAPTDEEQAPAPKS